MSALPSGWKRRAFDDVIRDVSGGNPKLLAGRFEAEGAYPVIDQGQSFIAGYSDDAANLCKAELPVIVFGDHTRAFKFVDFPFCMGADGTKILRPANGDDPRYLYYFLRQIRLPEAGYSRHFKYLRDSEILLPPFDEQRRIAEVLDRAEALRAKRRAALAEVDGLADGIFLEMFGDPVANSMGWPESRTLGEVAEIASGITKGRKLNGGFTRAVPYLAVANVQDRALNLAVIKTIEATEAEISRYRLQPNDLLLTEGGDPDKLGRGTLWTGELPECIHQNHVFRVRVTDSGLEPLFLNWLVGSQRGKKYFLRSAKQTTGIASINMTQLREFPLLLPPLAVQQEFARRFEAIERIKTAQRASLAEMDALFASLQDRAFKGEL